MPVFLNYLVSLGYLFLHISSTNIEARQFHGKSICLLPQRLKVTASSNT